MTAHDTSGSESDSQDESSQWRQADQFSLDSVAVTSATGEPGLVETTNGVALVSQSCDVVLPHRLNVQVAPIIELVGNDARAARDGKRSRYAHLPRLGDTSFADLDHVSTVAKTALAGKRVGEGVAGDDETRRFAAAIARRFGRFAFPDDVSDAMKALRDLVQSKATKPQSPFGRVLADVLELRAESKAWAAVASEVTIVFVLFPGALPTLPDDDPGTRPATLDKYEPDESTAQAKLTEVAEALTKPDATWGAHEKFWLWTLLADAAAILCETEGRATNASTHPTFVGEVVSGDEFPLTRVRRSEIVDLDHLSAPYPLEAQ